MKWRNYQSGQHVADIGERFVSYADEGSGEPVILLHGIPTWGFVWHELIPALAHQHRVLAPDLPGFGYSDRSDRFDRSIVRQADYVVRWMDRIGLSKVHLVGHDVGGGVALRLATLFPDRITRLCLMNTVCYDSWPVEAMIQLGHPDANRLFSAGVMRRMLKQGLRLGFSNQPDEDVLDGLVAPYTTEVGKLSLIRNASALDTNLTMELVPRLSRIEAPTLILWGENDRFQRVELAERLAGDLPDARLVRIKNANHFVMLDQPDEVARHLTAFLRGVEAAPEVPMGRAA